MYDFDPKDIDPRFAKTMFVVEADGYAMNGLWKEFSIEGKQFGSRGQYEKDFTRLNWIQDNPGKLYEIGTCDDRPVCVSFFWNRLNGHYVLFYSGSSQVVDHKMIEDWLYKYCCPKYDNGRIAMTDAMNFHICHNHIKELCYGS